MQATLSQYYTHFLSELNPPKWLVIPFVSIGILDIISTYYALYVSTGPFFEYNAIPLFLMDTFGAYGLFLPYPLGFLLWAGLSYLHPWRSLAFRVLGIYYTVYAGFIVTHNYYLIADYYLTIF